MAWLGTLESIFTLEGRPGHEIVLVFDAVFRDRSLYRQETISAHEHTIGVDFTAIWRSLDELASGRTRLVPEGLMEFLREQEECRARLPR